MTTYLPRFARVSLAVLAIAAAGCGRQAHQNPPVLQPEHGSQPVAAVAAPTAPTLTSPPVNTVTLPPTPVPATFDVAVLSDKVKPQVVNITTTERFAARGAPSGRVDPFEFFFGQRQGPDPGAPERERKRQALGTGVIIDPAGYVVTNEHVIHDADEVRVRLNDEREFVADVVGRDPKLDIALIKLKNGKDLPAAPLGSSEQLRVGEHVLAVGNPFGLGHTVTLGIVSAKARAIGAGPYDEFIQTDASINPGNSGGPLFNWRGEVIGINTAIRPGANGIGFAIPIDAVKDVLGQLREKGRVERGRLGLAFQSMTPALATALGVDGPKGALVSDVEPGGAAARAGIKAGDVVLSVNGAPIQHAEELPRRVARNAPGSTIKVVLVRDKQQREVSPTLDVLRDEDAPASGTRRGVKPSAQPVDKLGLRVSDAPGGGARVDDVVDDANIRDVAPGDVIIEVNRTPVKDAPSFHAAMAKQPPGGTVLVKVRRGRLTQFAAVPIPTK
jgi:serine protease Do